MKHLCVLLCLFGLKCGGARLTWPETYHYKGLMTIPSANLTEPFEFWGDTASEKYRISINNGITNIIQKAIGHNPTFYMVNPETTDSYQNKISCRELGNHSYAARTLHNAKLPPSGYLKRIDREDLDGNKTIRWMYSSKILEYNASFEHIVWTNTERFDANNEKVWKPIKYVNRLLHDSTTLKFIQFDYHQFDANTLDPAVFDLANGMKCRYYDNNNIPEFNFEQLNPVSEQYTRSEMFERFKVNHKKMYKNKDENFMRLEVFKDNLRYIDSINRQGTSYTLAVNQFSDMTEDELSLFTSSGISSEVLFDSMGEFVDDTKDNVSQQKHTFDWRDIYGAVTSVKDQTLLCGSCYAFAAAAAVESTAYISRGCQGWNEVSEQAIVDCSWQFGSFGNNGCEGGKLDYTLQWIKDHGVPYKRDYGPYLATPGYCHMNQSQLATISNYTLLPRDVSLMKKMIRTNGPLLALINSPKSMFYYSSGIYNDTDCSSSPHTRKHGVVVVGYGKEEGQRYWIIKNSFGHKWGDKGYIKINMNNNMCGVANFAVAVFFDQSLYRDCF